VGLATATPGELAGALLERADRALYAAKAAGRNCVRGSFERTGQMQLRSAMAS
jgi:PleD family two-component response regulator